MKKFLMFVKRMYAQMFYIPSAEQIAQHELDEAKRELLAMQTAKDYAGRMVEYHMDRIRRLTSYVNKANELNETKGETP